MKKIIIYNLVAFSFITSVTSPALGADTVAYRYDVLGRLIESRTTGGPNNSLGQTVAYDPAGNRTSLVIGGAGGPSDPPPPPPGNNPPIAKADNGGSMQKCSVKTVSVTSNDTDPDGDYPLTVINAWGSGDMNAFVASATSVLIESGQSTGAKIINYTISDSRGATAAGTISITVANGVCQ